MCIEYIFFKIQIDLVSWSDRLWASLGCYLGLKARPIGGVNMINVNRPPNGTQITGLANAMKNQSLPKITACLKYLCQSWQWFLTVMWQRVPLY